MDILLLGHSLIEFFDWQKRFPEHRAANLGVAGETVEGLLSRIDRITKEYDSADLIFVMTGLNNMAIEDSGFLGSYRNIVEKLKAAYPSARIFINSILPVIFEFISKESIREVNLSLEKLAADTGVEFLNIHALFVDAKGMPVKEYLEDDGVHLSEKGYAVWSDALDEIIERF